MPVTLKMLVQHGIHNAGELVGFAESEARKLIAEGKAEFHSETTPPPALHPDVADNAPIFIGQPGMSEDDKAAQAAIAAAATQGAPGEGQDGEDDGDLDAGGALTGTDQGGAQTAGQNASPATGDGSATVGGASSPPGATDDPSQTRNQTGDDGTGAGGGDGGDDKDKAG